MICLPKELADKFKEMLISGKVNPEELSSMTSQERRAFFTDTLGEKNAQNVNALFESKLLLKNQQAGIITWAREVAGLKGQALNDILSKVNKMTEVLNPTSEKAFLQDLANKKLGTDVTFEEATKISELAKKTSEAKAKIDPNSPPGSADRLAYGRSLVEFGDYINELKNESKKLTLKERANPKNYVKNVSDLGGLSKSLKATLDNSVIFRQGLKTMFTNPVIWLKNSVQSFKDIIDTFGNKNVMNEVRADVYSRPNALNGLYKKEGLAIGNVEEQFPTSLPEKVPIAGKVFTAAENAFKGFQYRTRADVFDKYVELAGKTGADIQGIGKLANSLTGRGTFGQRLEGAASTVNNVFFSPRFLKSNIDLLTAHALDTEIGSFARKQAAINLVKVIGGIGTVALIANAVSPGSVELDPRSSDFGKIRVGDTRFDITAGMASLATLVAREVTQSSKSSTTGKISKLNSGEFGSQNGMDVLVNFAEGKLAPIASVLKDILKGQDFQGNKPTLANEANNLLTPLPITTYQELANNPRSANKLISIILDGLGVATNTYSQTTDWNQSTGKELLQFKSTVGDAKFKEANDLYNQRYNDWFDTLKTNKQFQALDDTTKQKVITNKKAEIKANIFQQYGFKYKTQKAPKTPKF